jgi:uncharacterized membrane protein YvlD (DUF360 family)
MSGHVGGRVYVNKIPNEYISALMICGGLLPGLKVAGLAGAILAAVVIGALHWLAGLLLRAVN